MKELLKLGFSECTIDEMLNQNPNIKDITYEELYQKIDILKNIGCSEEQVLNIIGSNPMYLDRSNNDVIKLLAFLDKLGFTVLSILIDSNPYILNGGRYDNIEHHYDLCSNCSIAVDKFIRKGKITI
jgi:hypothetical protein